MGLYKGRSGWGYTKEGVGGVIQRKEWVGSYKGRSGWVHQLNPMTLHHGVELCYEVVNLKMTNMTTYSPATKLFVNKLSALRASF